MSTDKVIYGFQLVLAVTLTGLLAVMTAAQGLTAGGVKWHVALLGVMTVVSLYGIKTAWQEWKSAE